MCKRQLDITACQVNYYLNARLATTGIGRNRGEDYYWTFLKKGQYSFFGVEVCPTCLCIIADIREPKFFLTYETGIDLCCCADDEVNVTSEAKVSQGSEGYTVGYSEDDKEYPDNMDEDAESIYSFDDYVTANVAARLHELGETFDQTALDYAAGLENMDPMDVLITLEEGAERHKDD